MAALGCRVDLATPVWPDRLVNQVLPDKEVNQVYRVLLEVPEFLVLSILSSAALEVSQTIFTDVRYMLSPVRLSSVICNVRAPYSAG